MSTNTSWVHSSQVLLQASPEHIMGAQFPGVITGKPVGMGGSLGRTEATGYGVVYTAREALKEIGIEMKGVTVSIQGSGNVAQYTLDLLEKSGAKICAISCWDNKDKKAYTYVSEAGIQFAQLLSSVDKFGTIDPAKAKEYDWKQLDGDAWIEQPVTVLIPAAQENMVNAANVEKIKDSVKLIAEGANGPTTPEADVVIQRKGIFMVPDFLCNAGGVTCSYFEQVQNNMNYYWEKDEVLTKLDQKMTSAFKAVSAMAKERKVYMRDAAYMISIKRVAEACRHRGWV